MCCFNLECAVCNALPLTADKWLELLFGCGWNFKFIPLKRAYEAESVFYLHSKTE